MMMNQYQDILKSFEVPGFIKAHLANQRLYSHTGRLVSFMLYFSALSGCGPSAYFFATHQSKLDESILIAILIAILLSAFMSMAGIVLGLIFSDPIKRMARRFIPSFRRDVKNFQDSALLVCQNHLCDTQWQHKIASEIEKTLDMKLGLEYNTQVRADLKEFKIACASEQYEEAMHRLMNIYAFFSSMQDVFHRREMVAQFDNRAEVVEAELSIGQSL